LFREVLVTRLIIYGDFNCPFSALASVRADALRATAANYEIDWRAVQHDRAIPTAGEPVGGDTAAALAAEVTKILELSDDVHLQLVVPPVRSNTAAASAALAAAGEGADRLRRRLFAAVWAEGRNLGDPAELEHVGAAGRDDLVAGRWQEEFEALPRPVTPTLVRPDGYVSRGLGALIRLGDLVAATRSE
jgi:2-hydroxychromene-2-carboxylate isomerase